MMRVSSILFDRTHQNTIEHISDILEVSGNGVIARKSGKYTKYFLVFDSLIPCLKSTVFTVLFCLTGNFVPVKQKALRAGCTRRNEVCYRFAVLRRRAKCSSPSRLRGGGVEVALPTLFKKMQTCDAHPEGWACNWLF